MLGARRSQPDARLSAPSSQPREIRAAFRNDLDGLFAPVLLAQAAMGRPLPALPCRLLQPNVVGFQMDALSTVVNLAVCAPARVCLLRRPVSWRALPPEKDA